MINKTGNIRIFVGFEPEQQQKSALKKSSAFLQALRGVRITPEKNLHVTLSFIGEIKNYDLPSYQSKFNHLAENLSSINLKFKALIFAPNKRNARMLWALYERSDAFVQATLLAHQIFGLPMPPQQRIKPHITLARFKDAEIVNNTIIPEIMLPDFQIGQLTLYQSILNSEESVYKAISIKDF